MTWPFGILKNPFVRARSVRTFLPTTASRRTCASNLRIVVPTFALPQPQVHRTRWQYPTSTASCLTRPPTPPPTRPPRGAGRPPARRSPLPIRPPRVVVRDHHGEVRDV